MMRDRGRGFSPETVAGAQGSGMGLMGISERARIMRARFQVNSAPGQGTTLTIRIGLGAAHNGN